MKIGSRTYYPRIATDTLGIKQSPEEIDPASLPVGRISQDQYSLGWMLRELAGEMSSVNAAYPLEYLELMQSLSLINPNVAQMVDNIVQLGNTGHKVMVKASNPATESKIFETLNRLNTTALGRHGGIDGFINSCLAQIARGGAVSVEWVVNDTLDNLNEVVFVPLKDIRFLFNTEVDAYVPHQKTCDLSHGHNGLIPLHSATYQYCPLQLLDNSPYAVPPILAALESITIQRDIVKNLRFISKKMGLLGFVNFLIRAPKQIPGETTDKYFSRCQGFLDDQAERLKHNYRDGIAVGFMDAFSVEHHSITGGAQGTKELFEMNEQQVFSGLKVDPALHGRTYSTTETYAGVVYEKMLSIITNYQRTVRTVLEYGYKLHLRLRGLEYEDLWIEFEPSQSLNAERDEDTYATKLNNLQLLYNQGIIDQQQFAQESGYESAASSGPRQANSVQVIDDEPAEQQQSILVYSRTTGRYALCRKQPKLLALPSVESPYESYHAEIARHYHHACAHGEAQLAPKVLTPAQRQVQEFQKLYFTEIFPIIRGATDATMGAVHLYLKDFDFSTGDSDLFSSGILETASAEFRENLNNSVFASKVLEDLTRIYRFFRLEDAEPFGGDFPIKPSFELIDRQAIRFMRDSDSFYFGRYFSDPQTQQSLKQWLTDDYLRSGRNLRDPGELNKFMKRFSGRVSQENYRILRVVETSTNRARNWGNIFSVQQAQAASIEITGPLDNLTCKWCQSMMGKKFKVDAVVQQVKEIINRDPEDLPQLNPFLPGKLHPAVVSEISEDQLLAQGIALPPYHPHCRHGYVVDQFK